MRAGVRSVACGAVMVALSAAFGVSGGREAVQRPDKSDPRACGALSSYVWFGKGADRKTDTMIAAAAAGEYEGVLLSVWVVDTRPYSQLRRAGQWRGPAVSVLGNLRVYRDGTRRRLFCVLEVGGASAGGIYLLSVNTSGKVAELTRSVNAGFPDFRIASGVPEIREVWTIERLERLKGWRPTKQYDGHVFVERILRMDPGGKFVLRATRPAVEDERRLTKQQFGQYLRDRARTELLLRGRPVVSPAR